MKEVQEMLQKELKKFKSVIIMHLKVKRIKRMKNIREDLSLAF